MPPSGGKWASEQLMSMSWGGGSVTMHTPVGAQEPGGPPWPPWVSGKDSRVGRVKVEHK